jgi:hypothetical protein
MRPSTLHAVTSFGLPSLPEIGVRPYGRAIDEPSTQ